MDKQQGWLRLENESLFSGLGLGYPVNISGELVFNTAMTGYPEALTDPSYYGQILILTNPPAGNYGIPDDKTTDGISLNLESEKVQVAALVFRNGSESFDHWQAKESLHSFLYKNQVPALVTPDTREITCQIREDGAMNGLLEFTGINETMSYKTDSPVAEVSIPDPVEYPRGKKKIIVVDCGVKHSLLRYLLEQDITVIRVPWDYDYTGLKSDGIIISNGPGNPENCPDTINILKKSLKGNIPILGICLGSQLLGLAAGARTYKLKYGHRGVNQPCLRSGTKRCYITAQNHGYAVDGMTLPEDWQEWFVNNHDGTNEGIIHKSKPFFGIQFHPEGGPGPSDTIFILDDFIRLAGKK